MLLRWSVENCEVLEHRVFDGRVTTAAHVHHIDGNRSNNDRSNLVEMTPAAHGEAHRQHDYADIARQYAEGVNLPELARRTGINTGNLHRIITDQGVPTRDHSKVTPEMEQALIDMMALGCRPVCWCERFGLARATATAVQRRHGLRAHPGRIPNDHRCPPIANARRSSATLPNDEEPN